MNAFVLVREVIAWKLFPGGQQEALQATHQTMLKVESEQNRLEYYRLWSAVHAQSDSRTNAEHG
jgi:hypothetical protein